MVKADSMKTRRHVLRLGAGLAAGAAVATTAAADVPGLSKASVGYQDVPKGGEVCAQCVYFVFYPATGPLPASKCKLVADNINPAGWCEVWAPKAG
jgi:hypothetical protein